MSLKSSVQILEEITNPESDTARLLRYKDELGSFSSFRTKERELNDKGGYISLTLEYIGNNGKILEVKYGYLKGNQYIISIGIK